MTVPIPNSDWLAWLNQYVDHNLDELTAADDALKKLSNSDPADSALRLFNDGDTALDNPACICELLSEVHPDPDVRSQAEELLQETIRRATIRGQDRELHDVLASVDTAGLDNDSARFVEQTLRDFRRNGIDADEQTRERIREIDDRMLVLDQEFSRNIRDDVRSIRLHPEQLAGMPGDWIREHPAADDGLVTVTTDYPDYMPFRTYAHDAQARLDLARQFLTRAWPANDTVLAELLSLRHEKATLLGYQDWPSYDAEVKMIGSGAAIPAFIDRIAGLADEPARREIALLLDRARRDDPSKTTLTPADSYYYREIYAREQFGVDAQDVRRYFDFERVHAGLLDVNGRLFNVSFRALDTPVWHPDVTSYDVLRDNEQLGRIHLDLHPREGKFKHAAQFEVAPGVRGQQLPEGVLVCNLPTGFMEHDDVVTLFHEFGHLMHHVLGGHQRFARFSGVATETDFIEAPSQMLEEWAWDPAVLAGFAVDESGTPIPSELVDRMRKADEFGKGYQARTQMYYAALSYYFHRDRPDDLLAISGDVHRQYHMLSALPDTAFHAAFGHLTGYSSGYYTYAWSEVIAKDMFSAFNAGDLMDSRAAGQYRERVLAPGGSADAAELVHDFLGRPYDFDAYERWLTS